MTSINWTNVTDLSQIPAQANVASDGAFWVSMLYMIWIIIILSLLNWGWEVALMASSFVCLVLGFFLVYTDLVDWQYLMTFAGILLLMFLYVTWTGNRSQR